MKNTEDNSASKDINSENDSKENEKANKENKIKLNRRKRERHALENIPQNILEVSKSGDNSTSLSIIKKTETIEKRKKSTNTSGSFVDYPIEQEILIFYSPNRKRSIKTQSISPIVDREAPGLRQSLRNLPLLKPPKLQRRNSRVAGKSCTEDAKFANISTECKQYKSSFLRSMGDISWMYIIDKQFLQTFDPFMKNRNHAIMWLIEINNMLQERTGVLLNGIRMFDIVLASVSIPKKLYVLVASTAFWIAAKFDNRNCMSIQRFIKSNDSYTKEQYVALEIKILHLLNYNVNMVDPTLFVDYICMRLQGKKSNIKNISMLYHCAYFFLELFALDCMYTTTDPIIMATAAVRTSMILLPEYSTYLDTLDNVIPDIKQEISEESTDEQHVHTRMIFLLSMACDRTHTFYNLFRKYYNADYCHVTKELRCILNHKNAMV